MSPLSGLITSKAPPPNRVAATVGELEEHFTEPAVMLAYAFNLFASNPSITEVQLYPDGEHGKLFDIRRWLEANGFLLSEPKGSTSYGGRYIDGRRSIQVTPRPGFGDVVASSRESTIVAECKGGVINTRHPGQKSRLRRGLCEAVGLLLSREEDGENHIAVVPHTAETALLAKRMSRRCLAANIRIVLLRKDGTVAQESYS